MNFVCFKSLMLCCVSFVLKAYQYLREEVKTFQGKPIKVGSHFIGLRLSWKENNLQIKRCSRTRCTLLVVISGSRHCQFMHFELYSNHFCSWMWSQKSNIIPCHAKWISREAHIQLFCRQLTNHRFLLKGFIQRSACYLRNTWSV